MIRGVIFDLDGTIYKGATEVPGASAFVRFLQTNNIKCMFVTNRANRTASDVTAHLQRFEIACNANDIVTSAQVTARALKPGMVYCIGEQGLIYELLSAGFSISDDCPQYVISSFDRSFSYEKLKSAVRHIRAGARFYATNADAFITLEDGIWPGSGAIAAAIETASGTKPVVIGKPDPLILNMSLDKMGVRAEEALNIGDNLATDVAAGIRAGIRTALILTGVSTRAHLALTATKPTWIVESYDELYRIVAKENNLTPPPP